MTEIERRIIREKQIVTKLVEEMGKAGWSPIYVNNGEENEPATDVATVLEHVFSVDEAWIYFKKGSMKVWVFCVGGNDTDIISDYSYRDQIQVEIDAIHDRVQAFSDSL